LTSYCFIYNPGANPAVSVKQFERLRKQTAGWERVRYLTSRKMGDLQSLAREAAKHHDVVIACGGDGTAHDVANGLMYTDAAMAVIPMGSGNDFAKSLNMPYDLDEALEIIQSGRTKRIDMGRCNETHFVNSLGIGFDGLANYYAYHSRLKGFPRYVWGALKANLYQDPMQVTISTDEEERTVSLLMITLANGRVEGGSFIVAPEARHDDGLLDVVTVGPISKFILPFLLPLLMIGRQQRIRQFGSFKTTNLRIRLDRPAYIHADGEIVDSNETEFEVEVLPSALKVIGNFQ